MSNENVIMDTKVLPTNHLHNSNQAIYRITSNEKNNSHWLAHLILVLIAVLRNEGLGKPVLMCRLIRAFAAYIH